MKKSRLNPISKKRQQEMFEEVEIRKALCTRARGTFYTWVGTFKQPDGTFQMPICNCIDGICEHCHKRHSKLEPHEWGKKRSHGGKISLTNSIMVGRRCHDILEGKIKEVIL